MSNTPMNPVVEMKINGVWVDITNDIRLSDADSGGGIRIKRGRSNESPVSEPTELDFTLNNGVSKVTGTLGQSGVYSLRNPNSPYYGLLNRNQPIRVGVNRFTDAFARTATNSWGTSPSTTNRENATVAGTTWTLNGTAANFDIAVSGNATIQAAAGYQSATVGTYADNEVYTRVKVSARTSEFGVMLRYVSSSSMVTAYVTFGATDQIRCGLITSGGSSSVNADLPVNIIAGNWYRMRAQAIGAFYRAKIWLDGTTEPDWQVKRWPVTNGFITDANNVGSVGLFANGGTDLVTFSSIQIDQWRAHAEITKLPPRWDLSLRDYWVPVSARGLSQRLGQGAKPLESAVSLHLNTYRDLSSMWHPLQTDGGLSVAANNIENAPTAKMNNTSAMTPDLIGAKALPGVTGAVKLEGNDSYIRATTKNHSTGNAWSCLWFFQLDAAVGTTSKLFSLTSSGTGKRIDIWLQTDNAVLVQIYDSDGTLLDSDLAAMWGFTDIPVGSWIAMTAYLFNFGSSVTWAVNYHRPGADNFYTVNGSYTGSCGRLTGWSALSSAAVVTAGGMSVTQVMHYAEDFPFVTNAFARAAAAYAEETVQTRVMRHADESGVPFAFYGTPNQAVETLGAQLPQTRLELWRDLADVIDGSLEEGRYGPELTFRAREALYWTIPITYTTSNLSDGLDPTPDDQTTRNSVTVVGQDSGTATSIQTDGPLNINDPSDDPDGIGLYEASYTYNLYDDGYQLQAAANHLRSRGTDPDARYPSVTFDLTSSSYTAALTARTMAIDTGSIISLEVTQQQPDPSYQLVQAIEETIDQYEWTITATTTPGSLYRVARVTNTARVSPAGQITSGSFVSGTGTALSSARIDSTYGLWVPTSTDAGVTGFDILVAGVRLRVTSITGSSSPQTINVQQTPINGVVKTIPSGSPIEIYQDYHWRIGR